MAVRCFFRVYLADKNVCVLIPCMWSCCASCFATSHHVIVPLKTFRTVLVVAFLLLLTQTRIFKRIKLFFLAFRLIQSPSSTGHARWLPVTHTVHQLAWPLSALHWRSTIPRRNRHGLLQDDLCTGNRSCKKPHWLTSLHHKESFHPCSWFGLQQQHHLKIINIRITYLLAWTYVSLEQRSLQRFGISLERHFETTQLWSRRLILCFAWRCCWAQSGRLGVLWGSGSWWNAYRRSRTWTWCPQRTRSELAQKT